MVVPLLVTNWSLRNAYLMITKHFKEHLLTCLREIRAIRLYWTQQCTIVTSLMDTVVLDW